MLFPSRPSQLLSSDDECLVWENQDECCRKDFEVTYKGNTRGKGGEMNANGPSLKR